MEEKDKLLSYSIDLGNKLYIFNIDDQIGEPKEYRELNKILGLDANFGDVVVLAINTDGGNLQSTIQLHNSLKSTKAHTKAVVYSAFSAGSILALSCDEVVLADHCQMMIHAASWGMSGKTDEISVQSNHFNKVVADLFNEVYKGFLTKGEINKVLDNKDIWLNKKEIETRLKKWQPIRSKNPK